jgi:hypothetical protein
VGGLLHLVLVLHGVGVGASRNDHGSVGVTFLHSLIVSDVLRIVIATKLLVQFSNNGELTRATVLASPQPPLMLGVRSGRGRLYLGHNYLLQVLAVGIFESVLGLDDSRLGREIVTRGVVVHHGFFEFIYTI